MPAGIARTNIWHLEADFARRLQDTIRARMMSPRSCDDDGAPVRKQRTSADRIKIASGPVADAQRADYPVVVDGQLAIVTMRGVMDRDSGWYSDCSTADLTAVLQACTGDEAIAQTLVIADSPGGSVDGLAEMGDAVKAHAAVKPVKFQVEGMLCSAAVYVSAHATAIYANRMDVIGSIGTRMLVYDFSKYFEDLGIKAIPIDTGEYKSAGAQGTPITDNHKAEWQKLVDAFFADFSKQMRDGRELSTAEFNAIADGRIWLAPEAKSLGLIDGIRTTAQTVESMRGARSNRSTAASAKAAAVAAKIRSRG